MDPVFKRLKGFNDLVGEESAIFSRMEAAARKVFARYDYEEIRTPILEVTELFRRSIGLETDVVGKEMFTFNDKKERSVTLRPEATAGVLRACIESGFLKDGKVNRFYTIGPMFRYERPQKGRLRQFHQINCECLGTDSPYADAELICMAWEFLNILEIDDLKLKINSLGCHECRPNYVNVLKEYLNKSDNDNLCIDCKIRKDKNPLRLLDCKEHGCKEILINAPIIIENLCDVCARHLEQVLSIISTQNIPYTIDNRLVRGLDYYTRTTFEIVSDGIGAQTAVAGGGRYDGLIAQLGGGDISGLGFACGMERLALLMKRNTLTTPDFYIITLTQNERFKAFEIMQFLRKSGFSGEMNYENGSLKSLMRRAAKISAKLILIYGPEEAKKEEIIVKNMESGEQKIAGLKQIGEVTGALLGY